MATKPTVADARWATDETNNTPPSSGQRDTGWTPGQDGVSDYDNVLKLEAYKWFQYLSDGAFTGAFSFASTISPAAITGTTNDYAPTGIADAQIIRQDLSGNATLTGLTGGASGRVMMIVNLHATNTLTLAHDVTSTAANRFYCPGGADVVLGEQHAAALLIYDATSSRWRVVSSTPQRKRRLIVSALDGEDHLDEWQASDGWMTPFGGSGAATMRLAITLPVGARITDMKLKIQRDTVDTIQAVFKSCTAAGTTVELSDVTSTTGAVQSEDLDMSGDALWPAGGVTIANDRAYYFLITASNSPSSDLRVYFADIQYEIANQ